MSTRKLFDELLIKFHREIVVLSRPNERGYDGLAVLLAL